MNLIKYLMVFFICFLAIEIDSYRILGVFTLAFRSHNIFFEALMKGLAKRGHQVDVISYYEMPNPPENYKTILNLGTLNYSHLRCQIPSVQYSIDLFKDVVNLLKINNCDLLSQEKMQRIIKNPPTDPAYDLIITEGLGMSCYYGLGPLLKVPVITVSASLEHSWISHNLGNPLSTAFFPTSMMSEFDMKSFMSRLKNTVKSLTDTYKFFSNSEKQTEVMRKYLSPDIPTIREVEKMVALSLVNTHYSLQGIRPTTPALVEVGGLHIEEDNTNFTTELKQWMDESRNGVLYVSIGTIVPIETLPKETISAFYASFSKLSPLKILIKTTDGYKLPPGLPENIRTSTWIPQIPVLRHNNTRAFITHGGMHSIQEAVYFGVPVIGMPLFYDQHQNVEILVKKNMAIQLKHDEITEECLDEALEKILNDSKYKEAAKSLSCLFRDRPMKAMYIANYWIEYVIRNGAQSLRSPALDLYWWQVQLLDVFGFFLFVFIIIACLTLISLIACFRKCFRKYPKNKVKKTD